MATAPAAGPNAVAPAVALDIARSGAARLAALVRPDGRFTYRYVHGRPTPEDDQYNALRHCGAIWSMLDIGRMGSRRPQSLVEPALRALQYLVAEMIRPFPNSEGVCVVDAGNSVKLGGAGLALVAISDAVALKHFDDLVEIAGSLGRFILSLRRPDGDFVHKLDLATGEVAPFRSNYYTGQALFGLLRLYRITREESWRDVAFDLLERLSRQDYGVTAKSHWMLYALDEAHGIEPRPLFRDYAGRIASAIVADPRYRMRMMSTPIACCTEGLLAYCRILRRESEGAMPPEGRPAANAIRQNLTLQLRWRLPDGGFLGGDKAPYVQIDFIQHNISAFAYMADLARPD